MALVDVKMLKDNRDKVKAMVKEATEIAMEAVGMQAEGYAKLKCPVDTGHLRDSISHQYVPSDNAEYIGTNVKYAPYVEFGTSKMKAQPFLKPSASEHSNEYRTIFQKTYQSEFK